MAEYEPKTHLNIGGTRGWTTACGIESHSLVDLHKFDEWCAVDCKRCRIAMAGIAAQRMAAWEKLKADVRRMSDQSFFDGVNPYDGVLDRMAELEVCDG